MRSIVRINGNRLRKVTPDLSTIGAIDKGLDAGPAAARVERWSERGVRLFTIGTDKLLFDDQCARYVSALRLEIAAGPDSIRARSLPSARGVGYASG